MVLAPAASSLCPVAGYRACASSLGPCSCSPGMITLRSFEGLIPPAAGWTQEQGAYNPGDCPASQLGTSPLDIPVSHGKSKAEDAGEALMMGGKPLPTGWAHALTPTCGMQPVRTGFNTSSHTKPPPWDYSGAAISQLPHRPGNSPCQDEASAEVPCAYLSQGACHFGTQVEAPKAPMAPQALLSPFAVTLGPCHIPRPFTRVCMGTCAHTCPIGAAPLHAQ